MSNWQPIETVPPFPFNKDYWFRSGPRYLFFAGGVEIGWFSYTRSGKGRWRGHYGIINPTHWMPLPEPPNE